MREGTSHNSRLSYSASPRRVSVPPTSLTRWGLVYRSKGHVIGRECVHMDIEVKFPEKLQLLFKPYVFDNVGYESIEQFKALNGGESAPVEDLHHARYKVLYGGRSAGRSWGVARAALLIGMGAGPAGSLVGIEGRKHDGLRTLCVREIQDSLRQSMRRTLADQIQLMGLGEYYEVLDEQIRGRKGSSAQGTDFFFEGLRRNTNKIKSYEGIDLVIAEEAAPISEASWKDLIPTIREDPPGGPLLQGSEFWINYNPENEEDETHQRFTVRRPQNALTIKMTFRDNPWLPKELLLDIENDKKRSYDLYLHVWEGECRQSLEGSVYADEMREASLQGRITEVEPSRLAPVTVYFDLGRSDYTSMWFIQRSGWDFRVIDFYQNNRKHIDHYLEVLQNRRYLYDCLWLPHDARQKVIGTKMSVEEQVKDKGFKDRVRIVPNLSVQDGINAARTVFPNCYFDRARCAEGLRALKHYSYDIDPVTKLIGTKPRHDQYSHAADAFRYFAIASKMGHNAIHIQLPPLDGKTAQPPSFVESLANTLGWMRQ